MSEVISVAQFRSDFPAFADGNIYPDAQVGMYLTQANSMVNEQRWGQLTVLGQELWAAHFLTLDHMDAVNIANGRPTGQSAGVMTSKSVGGVSASYDFASISEKDAGFWNQTAYGRRYIRFARMAGMGGIQVYGRTAIP